MADTTYDSLLADLSQCGLAAEIDKPMAMLTTYAVGGSADIAVTVRSEQEIQHVAAVLSRYSDVNVVVLGRGSNTLFSDSGYRGVVVILGTSDESRNITVVNGNVRASASMLMPVLARRSVQQGCGGLEWCVGIPGTVGGAIRMNAGGHGADIAESLVSATVVSLRSGVSKPLETSALGLHFRGSALSPHHVVSAATFRVTSISVEEGTRTLDDIVAWRRANQPGGRNAGSVFVNPAPGEGSAGSLIDQCGLRGFSIGGAHVSEKHANFIQATDEATASDVLAVMNHVQSVVADRLGVMLRSEVRLVGFDADVVAQFSDVLHDSGDNALARHRVRVELGESDD